MSSECGQGTVEWVGLVLLVALAFGALASAAPRVEGRRLGEALAGRLTCAASGGCDEDGGAAGRRRPAARTDRPVLPGGAVKPPGAADRGRAFRSLPGVREVGRRMWIVCMAERRSRFESAHPQVAIPGQALPLPEALKIANACLNPVSFLLRGAGG